MIQATQIRVGMILLHEGDLYRVLAIQHVTPGNKRGKMQVEMRRLKDGTKIDYRFRSEDSVERATLEQRDMEYLYQEGDHYCFMDSTTYEQVHLSTDLLGNATHYLQPNTKVVVDLYDEKPVGVEIPGTMNLKVVETEPVFKAATAASSYKPAKLENGITVKVPPFVKEGDLVKVDTSSDEYLERVS
ncbi:MAG: elongation factor P [Deltaproteobacteria bacterium]|nr:elongation factor P [Deltaproteobacteria bacterium]MBI4196499.1 elongation factor P [Deltaproteobacteria bacterium]